LIRNIKLKKMERLTVNNYGDQYGGDDEDYIETQEPPRDPIQEVVLDTLAALKIIKHCNDNIPSMVTGSILGLDYDGVLEISYSYPSLPKSSGGDVEEIEGAEYQEAMMKMLEDVEVDNNCVGWYITTYLGTICTPDLVNYQYSYQTSDMLSTNTVVIVYDPIQSKRGKIAMKAFRLSDKFMEIKKKSVNEYIKPSEILQELPVRIKSVGHASAFLRCLQDSHKAELDCDFDALSLSSSDAYTENNLERLGSWLEDLVLEQQRFIIYSKQAAKPRQDHMKWLNRIHKQNHERRENKMELLSTRFEDSNLRPLPEVPPRTEALLAMGQLERYTDQLNTHVDSSLHKLVVTSQVN